MYQEYLIIGISFIGIAIILGIIGIFSSKQKKSENVKLSAKKKIVSDKTETIYMDANMNVGKETELAATQGLPDETETLIQDTSVSQTSSGTSAKQTKKYRALDEGSVVNQRYRVERILGKGQQGSVYVCTNIELGNMWAMKHFQGSMNEKDILVKLNHISLPKIADVFSDDNDQYIVESFVEGVPLHKFAKENQEVLTEDLAIIFMIQLSEALQYIHKQNIIHMDIKPQNIIITEDLKAILIDFGISSLRDGIKNKRYEVRGYTPSFASPEQVAAREDIDERTDIYSLGATIAYIFKENTISKGFASILNQCTAEDKKMRFANVKELYDSLHQLQKQKIDAIHRKKRNRLLRRLALPLIAIGAISLVYYGYLQQREYRSELILSPIDYTLSEQKQVPITITQRYADGKERILPDKWVQWKSADESIAILNEGVILAKNEGKTILNGRYYDKLIQIPITVEQGVLGVDIALKYSQNAQTDVYLGTSERDRVDGNVKEAAFFEPRSMLKFNETQYVVDGELREIKNNQVTTVDLNFLQPDIIRENEGKVYISSKSWQNEEEILTGIFYMDMDKQSLEEVVILPSALREINDFLPTETGIYFLFTDYASEKTDFCYYDFKTENLSVLLEQIDELNAITKTEDGQIYLAEAKANIIYRFNGKELEYFAGAKYEKDFVDGPIPKFYMPQALTSDGKNLYVWDYHMLRKIKIENGKIIDTISLSGQADQENSELVLTGSAYEVSYNHSTKVDIYYKDHKIYICQPNSSYIRVVEE